MEIKNWRRFRDADWEKLTEADYEAIQRHELNKQNSLMIKGYEKKGIENLTGGELFMYDYFLWKKELSDEKTKHQNDKETRNENKHK